MDINDLKNQILVKQTQIRVEQDPERKSELSKQLKKMQLQKEIESIKIKIAQLS